MILSNDKIFRHYKGGYYRLITDQANMELTGGKVVVYRNMEGKIFVRPWEDFYGMVVDNGEDKRRFEELK
jgi:hypothetical protein